MAFKATELGVFPSATGTGGFLSYLAEDDTLAQVKGAGFWNTDLSGVADAANLKARTAAEDFVAKQSPDNVGVPILMRGNAATGQEWDTAYLHTDGRIRLRGANFNIS